jgi:hypothetical protein
MEAVSDDLVAGGIINGSLESNDSLERFCGFDMVSVSTSEPKHLWKKTARRGNYIINDFNSDEIGRILKAPIN